jgi:hypothetical protein
MVPKEKGDECVRALSFLIQIQSMEPDTNIVVGEI